MAQRIGNELASVAEPIAVTVIPRGFDRRLTVGGVILIRRVSPGREELFETAQQPVDVVPVGVGRESDP